MSQDRYEDLCKFYEFMLGPLPWRDEFKAALQDTIAADELDLFFALPFSGASDLTKLHKKTKLPLARLEAMLASMASEGLVMAYSHQGEAVYERGNPIFMTEQQVRKPEDTPRRAFYARFFNTILNGDVTIAAPTKTPYYRVLPVEATLTGSHGGQVIPVNVDIPDPRAVLPIDVVSEMIRRDGQVIGVADCYCRRTKQLVGEGCGHSLQTCLVFNKVAETLIEHGTARRIDLDEALRIVREAESEGLVHNVDNCEGEIGSVCNCCPCCSILLRSWQRGMRNADSPSRYMVVHDVDHCTLCLDCVTHCPTRARSAASGFIHIEDDQCLGCGLCVGACAVGANQMVLRSGQAPLPRTGQDLARQIGREAIVGITKQRVMGVFRRSPG